MCKIYIGLFICCMFSQSMAQNNDQYNFKFKSYTTLQGLSDNTIVKTVKDKYGFLWIATHNGVNKFDGLNFKTYTHDPNDSNSLRSIWIADLLIDNNQILWLSTEWGLCYYDETKDRFKYLNDRSSIQLVYKMPLCNDRKNNIWIAAEDGLKKVNTATKKYINTSLKRIPDPQFIVEDNNGYLIIGTRGKGIYNYNPLNDSYKLLQFKGIPSDTHFMDAIRDKDAVWIASSEGLLLLKNNETFELFNNGLYTLKNKKIDQLMCVQKFEAAFGDKEIVCGTYDKKLLLFDKFKKAFVYQWQSTTINPGGFEPAIVYSIQQDNNILWIGTNKGLTQLNLKDQQQQSFFIPSLLMENNNALVKKVVANNGDDLNKLWLIPWQPYNGIILYDFKNKKIIKEWHTRNSKIIRKYTDLFYSKINHNVIAARDSALDFFDADKGFLKTINIKGKVLSIEEDVHGNVWIGYTDGLIYLNIKNSSLKPFFPSFEGTEVEKTSFGGTFPVNDIKIGDQNTLWLASVKYGLFSFDINTNIFTPHRQFSDRTFSTQNRCSSLTIIGNDSVWVGTMAGLTCYVKPQNKFINFNINNGLKSTYVYSITKDDNNNIWGRGNADIFCFNTNTKNIITSNLGQPYDGFYYEQKITSALNKILLGHEGGFTIFNKNDFIKTVEEIPVALITNCTINNEPFYFNKDSCSVVPLQLKYFQNQISFDLNAVEYNFPQDVEYWYMLEGIDKVWTNGGIKRSINYNNLLQGKYRFSLYVVNNRNKTKSKITSFLFLIKPAWWQYWWIWPAFAFLFAASVIIIAKRRIQNIREKEKQRTAVNKAMAELETKMLRSQMNPHFIFNSLNSIQKYIWENKEEDAAEYLARFAKLMRAILENSRKETVLLKEEIDVMKLYVDLEHRRSNGGFDYAIKTDASLFEKNVLIPPLIMQPFIENAIWHGLNRKNSKGHLYIQVFEKNNNLVCIIDDDGVGRHQKKEPLSPEKKSMGIFITQQRIEKLIETTGQNATITIKDKTENGEAAGTEVTITLPMQTL